MSLLDEDGFPMDKERVVSWTDGFVEIIRAPGTEFRDGEFQPLNKFGLFWLTGPMAERGKLVCEGTFDYVSNYYCGEFA